MIAIIGYKGFIGSALYRHAMVNIEEEVVGISRENYKLWSHYHRPWSKIIFAAGMSSKIDCKPVSINDKCYKENVLAVEKAVKDFPCDQFIYISSYDVYDPPYFGTPPDEDGPLMMDREWEREGYGLYKWMGEEEAKKANGYLILRSNGFMGRGLKKNVIFDLAQPDPKLFVSWGSRFQYMHTDLFSKLLFKISEKYNNEIINITTPEPITPITIAEVLNVDIKKVRMPTDKSLSRRQAVMNTEKLEKICKELAIDIPSVREQLMSWNTNMF